jgi:hypothetical protein
MTDHEVDKLIKIQGTDYDRRRKLKTKDITCIQRCYKRGVSLVDLARKYKVSPGTIKYHVDAKFKIAQNNTRASFGYAPFDETAQRNSRVAYKRSILNNNMNYSICSRYEANDACLIFYFSGGILR